MKNLINTARLLFVWLFLLGTKSLCWGATESPKSVSSLDELINVLQETTLRADEGETDVSDIYIKSDIEVDKPIEVQKTTPFRIYGYSLVRKFGYAGSILILEDGSDLTLESNIDGKDVTADEPEIVVNSGAILRISGSEIKNVLHSKYQMGVVENAGTMQMLKGTIDTHSSTQQMTDVYSYGLLNTGILELKDGIVRNWIKDFGQTIVYGNQSMNISGILVGENPIKIASKLNREILLRKGSSMISGSGFKAKDIIAQGTSSYAVTSEDAKMIILTPVLEKQVVDNTIILAGDSEEEIPVIFNLQHEIDNASGTFSTPTTITIPEKGITLSAPVTIEGKYVKITGGTIKADFSKTQWLTMFEIKSGNVKFENIKLDGTKSAAANNWCTFIRQSGGSCYLERGTVLTNALGHYDRYNGILITGGYCYLNKGARIELNTYGIGGTVLVEGDGHFSISDGIMYANEDGNGNNIENGVAHPRFGTVYIGKGGYMTFYSGEVSHDYVSIGVAGDLMYGTVANAKLFADAIKMFKGGTITLGAALSDKVNLLFDDEVAEGDVIVKGMDSHQLTASDLEKFTLPEGLSLKWVADTFVLSRGSESSGITTVDELQAAIDAAPTGTADEPTELAITSAGIDFNKTVTIKGKHIKLTGNGVVYSNIITSNIRMFSVESQGSLNIESATFLGTKTGTNAYCTFVSVGVGSSVVLNKVTMQKSLSELNTWTMLRVYGNCTLMDCTISENNGSGLIYIGSNGNCRIDGGKIQNNSCSDGKSVHSLIMNLGTLEYISGEFTNNHAISISSDGTMTLRYPHIQNYLSTYIKDEGSGIWVSGVLNLYNTATIGDDFYMDKSGSRRGCLNIYGALKSNLGLVCHSAEDGWVIAKGINYTLTEADLKKIVLANALAKEYTLNKIDNTFVLKALSGKSYKVKTTISLNGKITSDKTTAAESEMVTVTATPSAGYKVYSEKLCYNNINKLQATGKANIFTFKMPAADATISAEFIPDDVNVAPVDTSKFDPDKDIIPDTGIGNLDSLIAILGGNPKNIVPKAEPVPEDKLPDALRDDVNEAESKGDEAIGSLQELIDILSKDNGQESQTYYVLPVKVTLVCYLPKTQVAEKLRSATIGSYYILNESQGKISRIIPTYEAETNTLIFQTDRLGIFTVMRSNSSTANEGITTETLRIDYHNNEISIYNLPVGEPYFIYDLSGRLLSTGIGAGSPVLYRPATAGIYIIKYKGGTQKVCIP